MPMLATSVAVVRKMLEAVAGSAPSFFRARGIIAPEMPLMRQLAVIATKTIKARCRRIALHGGVDQHAYASGNPD